MHIMKQIAVYIFMGFNISFGGLGDSYADFLSSLL